MSIVGALTLIAAAQVQVGDVGAWSLYRGNGYCAAATTFGRDLHVIVHHDPANNSAYMTLARPTWRAVEEGRSYRTRIDFSNDSYYDAPPSRGVVMGEGDDREAGLAIHLNGVEFIADFAAANWMEVRLEGVLIASLNLAGTAAVMRQVSQCSGRAFREDTRDPFERVPSNNPTSSSEAATDAGYRPPRLRSGTISNDDYPAAAVRANAQGSTRMDLTIDPSGRVSACLVTQSSGSPDLDSAACRLAQMRYRYSPATRDGVPVAATVSTSVRWSLPLE